MLPENIFLVDSNPRLVNAWADAFKRVEGVSIRCADFFSVPADAMVSPANSFGIMDGGLDLAIRDTLGFAVQSRVQAALVDIFHGELPVGSATIVATDHSMWPWLVVAPTMRVPEPISGTINPYLAFRAALLAVLKHNADGASAPIRSVVVPGMGTGVGGVAPVRCAAQMKMAFYQASSPARIASADRILKM